MDRPFIVRATIHSKGTVQHMYWTLSGSVVDKNKAHVFTDATMPDFFKQTLAQPYMDKIYIN